ncbi:hypothetical protein [Burkholderia thailandensis]|nr:hypothetical protein [Burkholderia thailandensis]MBS2131324.1 hypothetical protein [Burkholderia thailandensis]MCS3400230.1 hypothetical protein [Burkholderia thailandensis]MCS6473403.1 hypothetical protein [Burkholderia thailandensis]MCS6476552.1 hypothetical protein [Burkholderia thailandensis]MCS6495258.1 hypothetical protein [Burkholderia thailandensis]
MRSVAARCGAFAPGHASSIGTGAAGLAAIRLETAAAAADHPGSSISLS